MSYFGVGGFWHAPHMQTRPGRHAKGHVAKAHGSTGVTHTFPLQVAGSLHAGRQMWPPTRTLKSRATCVDPSRFLIRSVRVPADASAEIWKDKRRRWADWPSMRKSEMSVGGLISICEKPTTERSGKPAVVRVTVARVPVSTLVGDRVTETPEVWEKGVAASAARTTMQAATP